MSDLRPRVLVTGMGAITAAGIGVDALWSAARDGVSGVGVLALDREGANRIKRGGQVRDFEPEQYIEPSRLPFCDRSTQLAIAAAQEALTQAGLAHEKPLGPRTAVILGTGIGGITTIEESLCNEYITKGRPSPYAVPRIMASAMASQVGMLYGCKGPTFVVSSACASASQAIGLGAHFIRCGMVDRAIVGGAEATLTVSNIRVWEALRVLTPDLCRPFSIDRNGMTLGEGSAILVLESEAAASARGTVPLAEIAGYGTTSDAFDIVRPDPRGAAEAMTLAIADSAMPIERIDYVNAHGTGTFANDVAEADALRRVFGPRLDDIAVSSTKPIHGHDLGATGAIELVITIMALRNDVAPPTINWLGPDPKCGLEPVSNEAREMPIRAALSNSFAFGGINASLVVSPVDAR